MTYITMTYITITITFKRHIFLLVLILQIIHTNNIPFKIIFNQ